MPQKAYLFGETNITFEFVITFEELVLVYWRITFGANKTALVKDLVVVQNSLIA